MPRYVVDRVRQALDNGEDLTQRKVLLLGLAYKADIADPRESPAFEIWHLLVTAGAEVDYHDPYFPSAPQMRSWSDLPHRDSVPLEAATLAGYDAVVLVTDHSSPDYELVLEHARLVIDTRGVLPTTAANVVRA